MAIDGEQGADEQFQSVCPVIDSHSWQQRQEFVRFDEQDQRILRQLKPLIERHVDAIVDTFHANVERFPELMAIIRDAGSSIDRLKEAQRQYIVELFSGDFGEDYLGSRRKIGLAHHRIGLGPQWYLGSYSIYTQAIVPVLRRRFRFNGKALERAILAVNKILSLDAQVAVDTYICALVGDIEQISFSRRDVAHRVVEYRRFVAAVATGDLTQRLEVTGDDELASLGDQLNDMTQRLADMAHQVSEASVTMMAAVEQLHNTIASQSAGAAQQASAVSETATTLEEIRVTANQTRDKASVLGESAERTRDEGERGQVTVEESIAAMKDIRAKVESIARNILALSEQTQQIGDITGLVGSLAQQLKILALNASIEAGKVGDAGKGFAVVAGEVRELAEQSQEATTQIQSILQEIQRATDKSVMATEEGTKGVDEGVRLVEQAGVAVRDLTAVIRETALSGQQIVAAVRQESSGIDQIAAAMRDINAATDQFLKATQQTKDTVGSLTDIGDKLRDSASVYKT